MNIATVTVMEMAKLKTFSTVRTFSSAIVAIAIAASITFSSWLGADSLNWQVVMAVVATIVTGLFAYVYSIDKKISKLENK